MVARVYAKRRSLAGSMSYRSWEKYDVGDSVTGKIIGFFEDNYDKTGMKVEVYETDFQDGTGEELVGKTLAINSCGALVEAIAEVKEMFETDPKTKIIIRMEYKGKVIVQKGTYAGKPCHTADMDLLDEEGNTTESYSSDDL